MEKNPAELDPARTLPDPPNPKKPCIFYLLGARGAPAGVPGGPYSHFLGVWTPIPENAWPTLQESFLDNFRDPQICNFGGRDSGGLLLGPARLGTP